jgi:hypothetical protein
MGKTLGEGLALEREKRGAAQFRSIQYNAKTSSAQYKFS